MPLRSAVHDIFTNCMLVPLPLPMGPQRAHFVSGPAHMQIVERMRCCTRCTVQVPRRSEHSALVAVSMVCCGERGARQWLDRADARRRELNSVVCTKLASMCGSTWTGHRPPWMGACGDAGHGVLAWVTAPTPATHGRRALSNHGHHACWVFTTVPSLKFERLFA